MRFEVYVNHPNNKAIIHKVSCYHLRKHGGVSSTSPPTGGYSERFNTLAEARGFATNSHKRERRSCSDCIGDGWSA